MAGGGASSTVWACALKADGSQIDCFLPNDSYLDNGVIPVKGSVEGNYKELFVTGGGSSSTVWACAVRFDGEAVDCFMPSDVYSNDGMITVMATYYFPSPAPSTQPSISFLPTQRPSDQPSPSPSKSPAPTESPSSAPSPGPTSSQTPTSATSPASAGESLPAFALHSAILLLVSLLALAAW